LTVETKMAESRTVDGDGDVIMDATRQRNSKSALVVPPSTPGQQEREVLDLVGLKSKVDLHQRILYLHRSVVLRPPLAVVDSKGSMAIQPEFVNDAQFIVKVSHDSEFAREDSILHHMLERLGERKAWQHFSFWVRPQDTHGRSFRMHPSVTKLLCPSLCKLYPGHDLKVRLTRFLGYSLTQLYHDKGFRMTAHFAIELIGRVLEIIQLLSSEDVRVQQGDLNSYNVIVEVSDLDLQHKCLFAPSTAVRVVDFGRATLLNRDAGTIGDVDDQSPLSLDDMMTSDKLPRRRHGGGLHGTGQQADVNEWIFDRGEQPLFDKQAGYMPPEMYCCTYPRSSIARLWPGLKDATWLNAWMPDVASGTGYRRLYAQSQTFMDRTMMYMFAYNMLLDGFLAKFVVHDERQWFLDHVGPILSKCVAELDPSKRPTMSALRNEIMRVRRDAHDVILSGDKLLTSFAFAKKYDLSWRASSPVSPAASVVSPVSAISASLVSLDVDTGSSPPTSESWWNKKPMQKWIGHVREATLAGGGVPTIVPPAAVSWFARQQSAIVPMLSMAAAPTAFDTHRQSQDDLNSSTCSFCDQNDCLGSCQESCSLGEYRDGDIEALLRCHEVMEEEEEKLV
jgi:hypothetical protein